MAGLSTLVIVGGTLVASPASGSIPRYWLDASAQCSFTAVVHFRPKLTFSGGGTRKSHVAGSLANCSINALNTAYRITSGTLRGYFADSPLSCASLSSTDAPLTANLTWQGTAQGFAARFHPTKVRANDLYLSFAPGIARVDIDVPATLAASCATGLRVATLTGTITLGPPCGPGSSQITIFEVRAGPMCGSVYNPTSVVAGPDGTLWFTTDGYIGDMTTSGADTLHPADGVLGSNGITAGPDGDLWFTGAMPTPRTSNMAGEVCRMTTSGVVANCFYDPSILYPGAITAGSDGALWFVNQGNPDHSGVSIGRITTAGQVSAYSDPAITDYPEDITAGPDGSLWFTTLSGIDRITTSGVVSSYPVASNVIPVAITAGPDGALWFTYNGGVGRITTSGAVTEYAGPQGTDGRSIATGPDGALWYANPTSVSVITAGTSFGYVGRVTTQGVFTQYTADGVFGPSGITTGPDGGLWFVNERNDTVGRLTP